MDNKIIDAIEKVIATDDAKFTDFDYSDIEIKGNTGIVQNLVLKYVDNILDEEEKEIEFGDVPFDFYGDCGDVCVDITDEEIEDVLGRCEEKAEFELADLYNYMIETAEDYI